MCGEDLGLDNQQFLIRYKTQPNQIMYIYIYINKEIGIK